MMRLVRVWCVLTFAVRAGGSSQIGIWRRLSIDDLPPCFCLKYHCFIMGYGDEAKHMWMTIRLLTVCSMGVGVLYALRSGFPSSVSGFLFVQTKLLA